jgi:P27 family predicted phage terminase small subunit
MAGGRRGPAPTPTALKEARGTNRKSRRNEREPKPELGDPGMPDSIKGDKDATKIWKSLAPKLLKLKLLTKVDGIALEGLCRAYSRALQADRALKTHGLLVKTAWGTLQASPAVGISRSSWAEVRKFAQEFGLTPSSRSRVTARTTMRARRERSEGRLAGRLPLQPGRIEDCRQYRTALSRRRSAPAKRVATPPSGGAPVLPTRTMGRYERLAYERHARDLALSQQSGGHPDGYWFDELEAERAVIFTQTFCRHHKGEWAGKPLLLEDWQKFCTRVDLRLEARGWHSSLPYRL